MARRKIRMAFIQIACNGDWVYGLDQEGQLWTRAHMASRWMPCAMPEKDAPELMQEPICE
jgi:hypothetical protein